MGYIRHHAIVVTSWGDNFAQVHEKARELCVVDGRYLVTEILNSPVNGYRSFMVVPDGSKEGWDSSDAGDAARQSFIDWMRSDSAKGFYCDWVLIQYGDDERVTKIIDHNDVERDKP